MKRANKHSLRGKLLAAIDKLPDGMEEQLLERALQMVRSYKTQSDAGFKSACINRLVRKKIFQKTMKKSGGEHDYYETASTPTLYEAHTLKRHGKKRVASALTRPFKGGKIIESLEVPRGYRKEGLASQLLSSIIGGNESPMWIRVEPYKDRPMDKNALQKFYQKLGFALSGHQDYLIYRR